MRTCLNSALLIIQSLCLVAVTSLGLAREAGAGSGHLPVTNTVRMNRAAIAIDAGSRRLLLSKVADTMTGRHYLIGVYADPEDAGTPSLMGSRWDYSINYSYQDDCAGCGVSGLAQLHGYPVIIDIYHVLPSFPSFEAAAAGDYDNSYEQTARSLLPYARQIYAIRIDSELNGSWSAASPFKHWIAVPPATWIAGFRRLATIIKSELPNARIIWNPCVGQNNPFPYYPGDDVVDLIGPDIYCDPRYSKSSHACWNDYLGGAGGVNLNAFAAFAEQHNKPIVIPEWGDVFGDGYMIAQMRDWMDNHNVVAQSYWDSGDALKNTAALPSLTTNQKAYVAAFGHRPFVGSYWGPLIALPAAAH